MTTVRWRRVTGSLLFTLHLLAGGVTLYADAQLGQRGPTPTHVESEGSHPCDTGHDHGHCIVCRVLSGQTPAPTLQIREATAARLPSAAAHRASWSATFEPRLHQSRAPPSFAIA